MVGERAGRILRRFERRRAAPSFSRTSVNMLVRFAPIMKQAVAGGDGIVLGVLVGRRARTKGDRAG